MSSGATGGQGGQAAPAAEMFPPADVEARIGWRFSKRELLAEALTHSTWANEAPSAPPDNERLEFVGDAVLGLLAARLLYEEPGRQQEGEMSRRRAHVVRRDALARQAERLGLAEHLRMGQGQKAAGVGRRMLADVFEAVVGAVFVDGGFEAAHTCFAPSMADALAKSLRPDDHKTQLQEICHRKGLAAPVYEIVEIRGPDHAREYDVSLRIGETVYLGQGSSKRRAESAAAALALATIAPEVLSAAPGVEGPPEESADESAEDTTPHQAPNPTS